MRRNRQERGALFFHHSLTAVQTVEALRYVSAKMRDSQNVILSRFAYRQGIWNRCGRHHYTEAEALVPERRS